MWKKMNFIAIIINVHIQISGEEEEEEEGEVGSWQVTQSTCLVFIGFLGLMTSRRPIWFI